MIWVGTNALYGHEWCKWQIEQSDAVPCLSCNGTESFCSCCYLRHSWPWSALVPVPNENDSCNMTVSLYKDACRRSCIWCWCKQCARQPFVNSQALLAKHRIIGDILHTVVHETHFKDSLIVYSLMPWCCALFILLSQTPNTLFALHFAPEMFFELYCCMKPPFVGWCSFQPIWVYIALKVSKTWNEQVNVTINTKRV